MLPLSPEPMRSSSGNSVESVEQPWRSSVELYKRRSAAVSCAGMYCLALLRTLG